MKFDVVQLESTGIDVIDGDRGKNYPHQNELLSTGFCLFLSAKNVTKSGFSFSETQFISQRKDALLNNGRLCRGDIVITTRGTVGNVALYSPQVPYENIRINSGMLIIRCANNISNQYLYQVLRSEWFQKQIMAVQSGSAQPQLPKSHFLKMKIPLPPLPIQEKIASILQLIDDKITTNNSINDNLQQQAFSAFDNLIANAENNDYTVSDYAFLNPKRTLAKNQVARSIDMSQLSTSGAFPSGWEMKPFNGGMRFTNGDTLLARITPCLENGKTAFIDFLDDGEVAFGSTEYIVLAPKNDTPPEMLYCLARYPAFVDYAVKNMNGSSGRQRVSAETVGQYRLPLFDKHSLVLFKEVVLPMFLKMRYNSLENMRLAELRDALLPKLMSGELDVSAIEL